MTTLYQSLLLSPSVLRRWKVVCLSQGERRGGGGQGGRGAGVRRVGTCIFTNERRWACAIFQQLPEEREREREREKQERGKKDERKERG